MGFPGGASGKEPSANAGNIRLGFDPSVGKSPWRRKWEPTPVILLGNLMGRGTWRATVHVIVKESGTT